MRGLRFALAAAAVALAGCSTVGASAVATGPLRLPPSQAPVAVYAAGLRPAGQDLGLVEAHGAQEEGVIELLLPAFVAKVAELGGDAAVIDKITARFEIVTHARVESYAYPCGWHATCTGTRMVPVSDEMLVVSMQGHAYRIAGGTR
jgi:hypothetical protein